MIAEASGHIAEATNLVIKIREVILDPLLLLLTGVALIVFIWGAFQYVFNASQGEVKEEGKKHMLWGIIGMVIMLSALTILRIALGTFDADCTVLPGGTANPECIQIEEYSPFP